MNKPRDLAADALKAWDINGRINLTLLQAVPNGGLLTVPIGSRGRNVGEVFAHLHRVRLMWLELDEPGLLAKLPKFQKGKPPTKPQLAAALKASGAAIATVIGDAMAGKRRLKAFRGNGVRMLAYLMAHDAHHRGQIALALKQNRMRLPDEVAYTGLWHQWLK